MSMTLSQIVGQRFCVGFATPEVPKDFRAFVRKTQIGSVILFSHNITSAAQVRALCEELQAIFLSETGRPGIIMADQEGGTVRRMPADAVLMPGAMALAAGGQDIRAASRIAGEELAAVGINMNLAPVADVNSNRLNPVISVRSYSDDPSRVGKACTQAILGLHDAGIYSCTKHFPGHGDTNVDSHLALPLVDKPFEEMEKVELVPFKAAIRAGTDAIMTTHILFPQLENEKIPATMSRTIMTGLLREKLGFEGLILSDCMMMNAIKEYYGTVEGCLAAVKAGVDIVLVSHSMDLMLEAWERVMQEAEQGRLDMDEMTASASRVMRYREMAPTFLGDLSRVGTKEHFDAAQAMMDSAICRIGGEMPRPTERSLFVAPVPNLAAKVSDALDPSLTFPGAMTKAFGGEGLLVSIDPTDAEIENAVAKAKDCDALFLGTVSALRYPGQERLMQALMSLEMPTAVITLRDPYELKLLKKGVCGIAAFAYNRTSLESVRKVLSGERIPSGTLPVKL